MARINIYINNDLYYEIKHYIKDNNMNINSFIEIAITEYFMNFMGINRNFIEDVFEFIKNNKKQVLEFIKLNEKET